MHKVDSNVSLLYLAKRIWEVKGRGLCASEDARLDTHTQRI